MNVGYLIEKKENKEMAKFKAETKNFKEDKDGLENAYLDMIEMIEDLDDETEKLLMRENLTKIAKSKFRISELFYKFLEFIKGQKIGIRMESLIENIQEYKKSNYTQKIKKINAAKKLSEVQKDI